MSRFFRVCLLTVAFLLFLLAALWFYDVQWGQDDGLLKTVAFYNVLALLLGWAALFTLMAGLLDSRFGWVRSIGSFLLSGVVMLLVLEAICWALAKTGVLSLPIVHHRLFVPSEVLTEQNRFAGDFSKLAGRWRLPDAHESLKNCAGDSLQRRTNAYGATDVPRLATPTDTGKRRVMVLGDSFVEGYMVNRPDRMTDLLEQQTGREHLNFGVNGSAPISYWLRYKEYSSQLTHGAVVVAILPGNDFEEYAPQSAHELVDYPIYRPYYAGTYPNFQVRYSLADLSQSIAAKERTPARLLRTIDSVYRVLPLEQKIKVHLYHSYLIQSLFYLAGKMNKAGKPFTRFHTFTDEEWLTMQAGLERIRQQAGNRPVVVLSLPILQDVEAARTGIVNRFDPRMAQFCQKQGIGFIPLLPHFLAHKGDVNNLYVTCDGHWSKQGERFVADVLLKSAVYRQAIGL